MATLVVAALAWGCDLTPPLPSGAMRLPLPPNYATWWSMVEECSGRVRPISEVDWYFVPGDGFNTSGGLDVDGLYRNGPDDVILAQKYLNAGPTVRHEMLHAVLDSRSGTVHDGEYFMGRCRGVVACNASCRASIDQYQIPSGALVVEPEVLVVELSGDTALSFSPLDTLPYTSIVVTARNPLSQAVAVKLPKVPYTTYRTFTVAVARLPFVFQHAADADSTDRYFRAGETKRFIFDVFLPLTTDRRGAWTATGGFANKPAPPFPFAVLR